MVTVRSAHTSPWTEQLPPSPPSLSTPSTLRRQILFPLPPLTHRVHTMSREPPSRINTIRYDTDTMTCPPTASRSLLEIAMKKLHESPSHEGNKHDGAAHNSTTSLTSPSPGSSNDVINSLIGMVLEQQARQAMYSRAMPGGAPPPNPGMPGGAPPNPMMMMWMQQQQQQQQQQLYIHPGECNEITMCKHTCTHTLLV